MYPKILVLYATSFVRKNRTPDKAKLYKDEACHIANLMWGYASLYHLRLDVLSCCDSPAFTYDFYKAGGYAGVIVCLRSLAEIGRDEYKGLWEEFENLSKHDVPVHFYLCNYKGLISSSDAEKYAKDWGQLNCGDSTAPSPSGASSLSEQEFVQRYNAVLHAKTDVTNVEPLVFRRVAVPWRFLGRYQGDASWVNSLTVPPARKSHLRDVPKTPGTIQKFCIKGVQGGMTLTIDDKEVVFKYARVCNYSATRMESEPFELTRNPRVMWEQECETDRTSSPRRGILENVSVAFGLRYE